MPEYLAESNVSSIYRNNLICNLLGKINLKTILTINLLATNSIKTIKESYCSHWRELLPSYKTKSFNKVRQQAAMYTADDSE